jgi:hypothetical protein
LRGALDLLISLADSPISLAVDIVDLAVNVGDVAFDLVCATENMIVALILGHAFEVLAVDVGHLLFIVVTVAGLGLHNHFNFLADATKLDVSFLCLIALILELLSQFGLLPLDASLSLHDYLLVLQKFLKLQFNLVDLLLQELNFVFAGFNLLPNLPCSVSEYILLFY